METLIKIRLATDTDIDRINSFYNTIYSSDRDFKKFNWEFNSAPAGKAIYVIAESDHEIVGTQCVIPYFIITSENKTLLSGKSEDTLVSPKHRGKQIFEKMYMLLLEECKKQGIEFIWGFTYAAKPFKKINFQIPFQSSIGILVQKPLPASTYLKSLAANRSFSDQIKIDVLASYSRLRGAIAFTFSTSKALITQNKLAPNREGFNYLKHKNTFGLKLDEAFLNYRIYSNPYNQNYKSVQLHLENGAQIEMVYQISDQKVGYIIHLYCSKQITSAQLKSFLKSSIQQSELKHCHILRFWGFKHCVQNKEELELLKQCGFTFINKGISFVWLNLNDQHHLSPSDFVLSRMASQGTD